MAKLHRIGLFAIVGSGSALACQHDVGGGSGLGTGEESTGAATGDAGGGSTGPGGSSGGQDSSTGGDSSSDGDKTKLDVGPDTNDSGDDPPACTVEPGELDALPPCGEIAPSDSFQAAVEWSWTGPDGFVDSLISPLVGNLTDDNGDGAVDLCDVPDIVVQAHAGINGSFDRMYVLDGGTGALHWQSTLEFALSMAPAMGDVDGDGGIEIVAGLGNGHVVLLDADGTVIWDREVPWILPFRASFALADLDADGDVEIIVGNGVLDHLGNTLWTVAEPLNYYHTTTAADLDGDGDLEVVIGRSAFEHTGEPVFIRDEVGPGHAHVADLDGDGDPEIIATGEAGISILEADGTPVVVDQRPMSPPPDYNNWRRPGAIHDFDGDGLPEFAMSASTTYAVIRPQDMSVMWQTAVADLTGSASGTAFDFLGDGRAEAIYGDETNLFVFDETGVPLLTEPRGSRTTIEYPVVADVDNDGSAEIVVTSESNLDGSPTLKVLGQAKGDWIPARRIWNQHTYHVTNVREDGTIPTVEPRHWELLNTFRTQAQFEGFVCQPAG